MTDGELAALHAAAMTLPRPWTTKEFAALRSIPGIVEIFRPGGMTLGRIVADESELLTIAVHPGHRRRGVAADMLSAFHAAARSRGAGSAFLEVADGNAAARSLYARAGYVAVGRRAGYYTEVAPPVDAIVMSRTL